MHCRAYLLLERDFQELMENNYKGIIAFPVSEDMMQWEAEIEGLQYSVWHGLFFQLSINFTLEYNLVPPDVKFRTIPFHPNVDRYTGRPCIDFLDDPNQWDTSYKLSSILLTLQVMLSNPVLENPVNLEAARMLMADESLYQITVLKLFNQPLQLGNGSSVSSEEPQEFVKSVKDVSFNDYYETWSVIATSNTTEYYRTPVLQDPDFIGRYYQWKKTDLKQAKEWRLKYVATLSQLTRENKTPQKSKYPTTRIHVGPTPDKASPESQMETDIVAKIFEEVKVWEGELSPPEYERSDMSWEEEVEDLVSWANTLNTNTLED
nr:ubiquitin-conjugating enzyme E2 U [Loxodonta africana]